MKTIRATSDSTQHELYPYQPSLAAAIIFVVAFCLATIFHSGQMIRKRTWFMIPFVIGGVFEAIGYVGRAASAHENPGPYSRGPFIVQTVLLLVAPALFAASIYMELGRIVLMVDGDDALFIRRKWLTKTFVAGDIIAFIVQAGGAGMISSKDSSLINTGKDVLLVGLFAQIASFAVFVAAAGIFHWRMTSKPTQLATVMPWRKHMIALYAVSLLIFARSIVRCVEFIEGTTGYISQHEPFLYCFDALPMFLVMVILAAVHPGEIAKHIRETTHGKEEGGLEFSTYTGTPSSDSV